MKRALWFIISACIVYSCKQLYTAPVKDTNTNYLVVDGFINTGNDSTIIKLSRTVNVSSKTSTKAEARASVTVESDANVIYPLKEIKTGIYGIAPLNLSKAAKYRLRIITTDRKIYLSDYVAVKETPPIDSIGYEILPSGLKIYANTHDDTNASRYYRWDYAETWKFRSFYPTDYIGTEKTVVKRTPEQNIYFCWGNRVASEVVLASSAKLTKDVIYQQPITTIPSASEKLGMGYSILVKQYALTEEAFNFWQLVKRNTEQLGSIFDAQPSQVKGNIHNINDLTEPVFGYISAGTVRQKRILVMNNQLPSGWGMDRSAYERCAILDSPVSKPMWPSVFFGGQLTELPVIPLVTPTGDTIAYKTSSPYCIDCTFRGTNKKPSFWPID